MLSEEHDHLKHVELPRSIATIASLDSAVLGLESELSKVHMSLLSVTQLQKSSARESVSVGTSPNESVIPTPNYDAFQASAHEVMEKEWQCWALE